MNTLTFSEYASIKAVNQSTLKHMARSPLHFKHAEENEVEDCTAFAIGRALHTAVLEPHRFEAEYAVFNGARRAGPEWKEFQAANAGRTLLKAEEHASVLKMAKKVRQHPAARAYLEAQGAMFERAITWLDSTGLQCKARLDLISTVIGEIKTTANLDERVFRATAARLGYFHQHAFYRRGIRALTRLTLPCVTIAVETDEPHDVGVFTIPDEALALADEHNTKLLQRVAECRASGEWPGRYPTEKPLPMPQWAVEGNENMEAY